MELTSEQSRSLKALIQGWSKNAKFELETTFGAGGVVNSNTFLQIAQRLRSKGFREIAQEDYLNIITPSGIRFTLQSLDAVQSYCRDDTLDGKTFTAMIKDHTSANDNLDISEYDIRIKIRREEELEEDHPRVKELLDKWKAQLKAFRLIRRWSFLGKGIRVDLSMVRQSQNDPMTRQFRWTTGFLDQRILPTMPRYEVEVELLHDTDDTQTPEKALISLIRGIGEVLRAIQKNSLLIRKEISNKVRKDYASLIGTEKFRGVGAVTIQVQNMMKEVDDRIPNVRTGYNVTDKADGLRAHGYVNSEGEFFLLDQSMNVYRTGLQNKNCANSLVDGEWVTSTKEDVAINHYLIFDIYYYEKKVVSTLPFMTFKDHVQEEDNNRYHFMLEWFTQWNTDGPTIVAKGVTELTQLKLILKEFKFAEDDRIFMGCSEILNQNQTRLYHTDGLIITSNSEPIPDRAGVRFDQQFKWKPAQDNTIDFLVVYEKSVEFPTLDQVTSGINESGETIQYKTMRLYVGSENMENPRSTILDMKSAVQNEKERYRPVLFVPTDFQDTMANTCHVLVENDPKSGEEYTMTEDSKEPITNRSIVEMRYDPTKPSGWRWIPTRIRHDKTERLLLAIAKGGTIKYTGMMNNDAVANSVWNSIHDPITESMIRRGNEQPNAEEMGEYMKHKSSETGKKYYERKASKEDLALVKGLRDFHNTYIKGYILLERVLKGGHKKLIDFACGQGGDLYKWIRGRAEYVLGIDYAGNNITNPHGGAYSRYVDIIKGSHGRTLPKIIFAIGNSANRIINGEAGSSPEEKDILRGVFGRTSPDGPLSPYVQKVMGGTFHDGADVSACMFAIHYFFENPRMLDGFLLNLEETVKQGGYFVGCCFDGDKIFNYLRNFQKGESITGTEGDTPIWSITKEYDKDELIPDDTSIGLPINVQFISIGSAQREYLVSFEFLCKRMKEKGFHLLNEKECKDIGLEKSSDTFDSTHKMAEREKKIYLMPKAVQDFSFLNRWFIFKKDQMEPEIPEIKMAIPPPKDEEEEEEEMKAVVQAPVADKEKVDVGFRLPDDKQKFTDAQIFKFGSDVTSADTLAIKDVHAAKWLALIAPFPIPDPEDPVIHYPSVDHYIAAMRIKHSSNNPHMAAKMFGSNQPFHQGYLTTRMTRRIEPESGEDFKLLKEEAAKIRSMLTKTALQPRGIQLDDGKWSLVKDRILREALQYRWVHDERFHKIVEAARDRNKYLLYSVASSAQNAFADELGGVRDIRTSLIKGENKVGRFIMEIAKFQFKIEK